MYGCADCGVDTFDIDESSYMLTDALWQKVCRQKRDMLCIGCVEQRLGRELVPADFKGDVPINQMSDRHSDRLRMRLAGKLFPETLAEIYARERKKFAESLARYCEKHKPFNRRCKSRRPEIAHQLVIRSS